VITGEKHLRRAKKFTLNGSFSSKGADVSLNILLYLPDDLCVGPIYVNFAAGTHAINPQKSSYLSFEIKRLKNILFPVKNKSQRLFATTDIKWF
jgi:hypothetical protein